ncbi:MAG: agmatinase [Methanobrevibacter sp.]|jgi:agmatinase|nr:agmatinase [Candidatus Methanovirga aequatorialis]
MFSWIYNHGIFLYSKTFGNKEKLEDPAWGIVGVPFDGTCSYHAGTRTAPTMIRDSSYSLEEYNLTYKKSIGNGSFYDLGNIDVVHGSVEETCSRIENSVKELSSLNLKPLLLGGEHTITFPALKALSREYNIKDITLIDFDAHCDMANTCQGGKFNHATVMRRIFELGPKEIIQIGIRSASEEEYEFIKSKENIRIFEPCELNMDPSSSIRKVIDSIEGPVYISIDCDGFDPAVIPNVGNPFPNGISMDVFERILPELCKKECIGFDIVELATNVLGDSSSVTASKVVYDFLTLMLNR